MAEPSVRLLWRLFGEAMVTYFRRDGAWEARLTPHSALVITGERRPDMNLMTIDDSADVAKIMRGYITLLAERRLPYAAFISDAAEERVRPILDEFALKRVSSVPLMTWRPAGQVIPSPDCTVEVVTDEEGLRASSRVLASAFGSARDGQAEQVPTLTLVAQGVTRFLARLDGVPVSAVTMTRSGRIAGIWSMGTARAHQGRGAGRAVLEHAIAYEQAAGAEWFFLGASDEGRPLYEKMGFREVAVAGLWTHDVGPEPDPHVM